MAEHSASSQHVGHGYYTIFLVVPPPALYLEGILPIFSMPYTHNIQTITEGDWLLEHRLLQMKKQQQKTIFATRMQQ